MFIGGIAAGCFASVTVFAAASSTPNLLQGHAWQQAAGERPLKALGLHTAPGATRVLAGISGEAIAVKSAAHANAGEAGWDPATADRSVSPAAWDRLSAGDCISLTTTSGQKLSFRIVGARPGETPATLDISPNLELAVTPCSPNSEGIAKAVIETKGEIPGKPQAVQRTL